MLSLEATPTLPKNSRSGDQTTRFLQFKSRLRIAFMMAFLARGMVWHAQACSKLSRRQLLLQQPLVELRFGLPGSGARETQARTER